MPLPSVTKTHSTLSLATHNQLKCHPVTEMLLLFISYHRSSCSPSGPIALDNGQLTTIPSEFGRALEWISSLESCQMGLWAWLAPQTEQKWSCVKILLHFLLLNPTTTTTIQFAFWKVTDAHYNYTSCFSDLDSANSHHETLCGTRLFDLLHHLSILSFPSLCGSTHQAHR